MHIFYAPDISSSQELDEIESKHATKVLRLQVGDQIQVIDGKGMFYSCTISDLAGKRCQLRTESTTQEDLFKLKIHLAVAPTKSNDRNEWIIEKACELGVKEITFLKTFHSERKHVNIDRLQKIAVSAIKQSQKARIPVVHDIIPLQQFIEERQEETLLVANQHHGNKTISNTIFQDSACIVIGPEGDFSNEEILLLNEKGFETISLGNSRLRTETAAIAACVELNLNNR